MGGVGTGCTARLSVYT